MHCDHEQGVHELHDVHGWHELPARRVRLDNQHDVLGVFARVCGRHV